MSEPFKVRHRGSAVLDVLWYSTPESLYRMQWTSLESSLTITHLLLTSAGLALGEEDAGVVGAWEWSQAGNPGRPTARRHSEKVLHSLFTSTTLTPVKSFCFKYLCID